MRDYYGNTILDFSYDANGQPYSMHYNSTPYFYILNLQGDVIRMVDGNGNTVASYEYDPYGRVISATGSMADINPLRYRGYYYDSETQLYHLWSRYYDPQTGRFINADSYASTGAGIIGNNMFAYCNNNPVNFGDPFGSLPMRKNMVYINDGAGGDIGPVGTISSRDWSSLNSYNNAPSKTMDYISNDDESVVLEAKHFAFYKGVPVFRVDLPGYGGGATYGIILLDADYQNDDKGRAALKHEYGHRLHFDQIGPIHYLFKAAIPSLIGAGLYSVGVPIPYYSQPWEYVANMYGNVNNVEYTPGADIWGTAYWLFTIISS